VGATTVETWKSLLEGRSGITNITQFDTTGFSSRVAGEVKNFEPTKFIEKKDVKKMGRFIQLGIAASLDALSMANFTVTEETAERVGVYIGSGIGGFEVIEREYQELLKHGPRRVSPFFIPATIVNMVSGYLSIRIGAKGPNSATATACTTSAHSIGDSFRIIQRDDADVMVCGGAEGCITPLAVAGFASARALSTRNDDPEHASRPFDKDRDGFVIGEGAGILVLEELEFAKKRGANILAEIVGYGMSADAFHFTAPPEDGEGAFRVMRNALRDAKIEPEAVDYINAHGTSTPLGDRAETVAMKRAFGDHAKKLAVSSTKSMTGHLLGGAGGLEAGVVVCAIRDQVAPPTANYDTPDPDCDLDYIPNEARPMKIDYALTNSFGFGGTNGALIFKRFTE
jgi:3-oxoacyl-[acyl-carrier-protein] synthase II